MPRSTIEIESGDVPQAPSLARIRCVITAAVDGASTIEQIAEETDISARHVGYALRAAQTLGLLDRERAATPLGRTLLDTEQESPEETAAFRKSIEESAIMRAIAPTLLGAKAPTKKALATRIEKLSGLSKATAEHRAWDLLSWREQILEIDAEAAPAAEAPTEATPAADDGAAESE
jgi:hypothetical protein